MQSNRNGKCCDKWNQMEWDDMEWNTDARTERERERVFKSFKPDINVFWRREGDGKWLWPMCVCMSVCTWMSVRVCLFLLFHSHCCCCSCCCSKLRATSKDATYSHWQLTMLPQRVGPGTPCRSQTTSHAPWPPYASSAVVDLTKDQHSGAKLLSFTRRIYWQRPEWTRASKTETTRER